MHDSFVQNTLITMFYMYISINHVCICVHYYIHMINGNHLQMMHYVIVLTLLKCTPPPIPLPVFKELINMIPCD